MKKKSTPGAAPLAPSLQQLLADSYLLYLKTQNFHWNVEDPRFSSLHKLFEEQYEELAEAVDLIAERLRGLGVKAPASMRQFLALSTLREAEGEYSGDEMLRQLAEDHAAIAAGLPASIEQATRAHDEGTGDLFIERLRVHQKTAWMLRSHFPNATK